MKYIYEVEDGAAPEYWEVEDEYEQVSDWEMTDRNCAYHLANEAAEHYHSNCDGWESDWPLTFHIYSVEEKKHIGSFHIEREAEPSFYATEIKS